MKCIVWIVLGCISNEIYGKRKDVATGMEKKVVGGVDVPIAAFPYIAQISAADKPHCGGVIVSDRVILTAAHCLKDDQTLIPVELLQVYVGSSKSLAGTKYSVCRIVPHKFYNLDAATSYFYDLGLVLLRRNLKFNKFVQKAQFATDYKWRNPEYTLTVAGYGIMSSTGMKFAKNLKGTRMRYVDRNVCNHTQAMDGHPMPVPSHMFCLVSAKWSSDCFGDSGSAVTWKGLVVGTVATGRDSSCGSESMPSLYIDVVYFHRWISVNVQTLEALPQGTCKRLKNKLNANGELQKDNGKNKEANKYDQRKRAPGFLLSARIYIIFPVYE